MEYSMHNGSLAVRTPFSERYDLTQIFSGILRPEDKPTRWNGPIDFRAAGFVRRERSDIWHIDRMLAFSTDEATPVMFGGGDVGANHGFPCLVRASLAAEEPLRAGAVLTDAEGHLWRVIRPVTSPDASVEASYLLLGRRLPGPLREKAFPDRIPGPLTLDGRRVEVTKQTGGHDLVPAMRHQVCRVEPDGDSLWLTEQYDISDPSHLAPENPVPWELLMTVENRYRIGPEGDVHVAFSYRNRTPEPLTLDVAMGLMYQERCDLGGGIRRMIPGTLPFRALCEDGEEHVLDYSVPTETGGPVFPASRVCLTKAYWADPACPPLWQRDELYEADGTMLCAFEAGFDGRNRPVETAWEIVPSRKTYPHYADQVTLLPGEAVEGSGWRRWRRA